MIRLILLKDLKAKEIYESLEMYKECSPSKCTVEFWAGEFKRGRTRRNPPEIIEQVHNIVSEDPSLTKREITNAIGISDERVLYILHGESCLES